MKFWSNFFVSIRRIGLVIWLIYASTYWLEQILTRKMEQELSAIEGTSNLVWIYAGSSAAISLITPIFTFILVISSLRADAIFPNVIRFFPQVLIEYMRSAGKSLLWSLMLIIPGLIRFLQFAFVSIIVMLDTDYYLGKKDALDESTRLVNRSFFKVLGIFLLFSVLLPFIETNWDEYQSFSTHPVSAFLMTGLDSMLSILFVLSLIKLWEKNHGTYVQLEAN